MLRYPLSRNLILVSPLPFSVLWFSGSPISTFFFSISKKARISVNGYDIFEALEELSADLSAQI